MYEIEKTLTIDHPMELYQSIFHHFRCPAHNIKMTYVLPIGTVILSTNVTKTDEKAEVVVSRSGDTLSWTTDGAIAKTPHQANATIQGVKATSKMIVQWKDFNEKEPEAKELAALIDRAAQIYNEEHHNKSFVWYPHQHGEQKMFAPGDEINFS